MNINSIIEILLAQLIGTVFAAVGIYTAIRADLAQLNARLKIAEDLATRANSRIDTMLQK